MSELTEVIGAMSTDTKPPTISSLIDFEIIDKESDYTAPIGEEKPIEQKPGEPTNPSSTQPGVIDAKTAILVADMILSRLMMLGASYMDLECKVSDFQLSAKEKETIEPVAGRLIAKYLPRLTDEAILAVIVCSIYGAKLLMLEKVSPETKAFRKLQREEKAKGQGRGRPPGAKNKQKQAA